MTDSSSVLVNEKAVEAAAFQIKCDLGTTITAARLAAHKALTAALPFLHPDRDAKADSTLYINRSDVRGIICGESQEMEGLLADVDKLPIFTAADFCASTAHYPDRDSVIECAREMREALVDCAEALAVARDKLGMCGEGDGKDRKADAEDTIGSLSALQGARAAITRYERSLKSTDAPEKGK